MSENTPTIQVPLQASDKLTYISDGVMFDDNVPYDGTWTYGGGDTIINIKGPTTQ